MNEKILIVDDDPALRAAYRHRLKEKFDVEFAPDGKQGLVLIEKNGPFAVIVSDMRMPKMNGIQFLSQVKDITPDSYRIMLTGYADLKTAVDAVNEGKIFQFLTKPCPVETLYQSLDTGIKMYKHIVAERELLEKTLSGSVNVLTEILSLVNPEAFGRASRIRSYVRDVVRKMKLSDLWQYELAAMLSQIGCLTIPPLIIHKIYAGEQLSEEEEKMFSSHPQVARNLLVHIPRLEPIARMIELQQKPFSYFSSLEEDIRDNNIILGAQILKIVLKFDQLIVNGMYHSRALLKLRSQKDEYNPKILDVLENLRIHKLNRVIKRVNVKELRNSMIIDEDIIAKNGVLLVSKGQVVTDPVLELLKSFSEGIGIIEPIRVVVLQ